MDSDEEGSAGREAAEEPKRPPPEPSEVETLGDMLRLADSLQHRKPDELTPKELVDICSAAARVKFYDPGMFADVLRPALLKLLKCGVVLKPDHFLLTISDITDILNDLARLNAAGALGDVFESAAKELKVVCEKIDGARVKMLKEIYNIAGRSDDVSWLTSLASTGATQEVTGSTREGISPDNLPMRPGARLCDSYVKTGQCRSGMSCRYDHPEGMRLTYNSEGYPMRPWAPLCPYYLSMSTCDFRKNCKWHHPEKRDRKEFGMGGPVLRLPRGGIT